MNTELMFSSKSNEWQTPVRLFNLLNEEFHFTLDPCATDDNHLCDRYFTIKENGLAQSWIGESVFMNPPYSKEIPKWMKKAYESSLHDDTCVVCLVPARTDTKWFHNYAIKGKIRFLKGRIKFENPNNHKITSAPFPSMIVIYDREAPMKGEFPYYEFSSV